MQIRTRQASQTCLYNTAAQTQLPFKQTLVHFYINVVLRQTHSLITFCKIRPFSPEPLLPPGPFLNKVSQLHKSGLKDGFKHARWHFKTACDRLVTSDYNQNQGFRNTVNFTASWLSYLPHKSNTNQNVMNTVFNSFLVIFFLFEWLKSFPKVT